MVDIGSSSTNMVTIFFEYSPAHAGTIFARISRFIGVASDANTTIVEISLTTGHAGTVRYTLEVVIFRTRIFTIGYTVAILIWVGLGLRAVDTDVTNQSVGVLRVFFAADTNTAFVYECRATTHVLTVVH
jgi:hypothetical protein